MRWLPYRLLVGFHANLVHCVYISSLQHVQLNLVDQELPGDWMAPVCHKVHQSFLKECFKIDNYETLLWVINNIIQKARKYGSIGPPIYMVLAQAMKTEGSNTRRAERAVQNHVQKHWTTYLSSADSRDVLNNDASKGGLFAAPALTALEEEYYRGKNFLEVFISCIRPAMFPDNDNVINAACESKLHNIATNVGKSDEFWLKGEPYSLAHMLDGNYLDNLIGGTIFQGFLEVSCRYSPVNGVTDEVVPIKGTYFAQCPAVLQGAYYSSAPRPRDQPIPVLRSLACITSLNTRTLIFIHADNLAIGLACFVAIGMTEISTCVVNENVVEGRRVTKGDDFGLFRFAGSSHALYP
ncbi:hypothetical protein B0H34DRAFT_675338 [Crassisporium funariophilum]|nr:hypothetical protein B0H34DRAFT_675338 [Crassisporium funariophilum]